MQQQPFDQNDFRQGLGLFPTGVTIVTTEADEPIGMTVSSFNTVSLDPPLVLWSIDRRSLSLDTFTKCEHFAINVLSKDQQDLSNRFASKGADKFADTPFTKGAGGSPLLESCIAQLECKTWQTYDGGDHVIIVGEVLNYRYDKTLEPLVFYAGNYAELSS
jgi:flavin reductase (DIM6/NTAB) family NADH-FMN oxidoreductase RutF